MEQDQGHFFYPAILCYPVVHGRLEYQPGNLLAQAQALCIQNAPIILMPDSLSCSGDTNLSYLALFL